MCSQHVDNSEMDNLHKNRQMGHCLNMSESTLIRKLFLQTVHCWTYFVILGAYIIKELQLLHLINYLTPSAGHSHLPFSWGHSKCLWRACCKRHGGSCSSPQKRKLKLDPIFLPNLYLSFSFLDLKNIDSNFGQPVLPHIWFGGGEAGPSRGVCLLCFPSSCVYNPKLGVSLTRAS